MPLLHPNCASLNYTFSGSLLPLNLDRGRNILSRETNKKHLGHAGSSSNKGPKMKIPLLLENEHLAGLGIPYISESGLPLASACSLTRLQHQNIIPQFQFVTQ